MHRPSPFDVPCGCSHFGSQPTRSTPGCRNGAQRSRPNRSPVRRTCAAPSSHPERLGATTHNGDVWWSEFGVPFETKLATSVSTTSLAVAIGGEVNMALVIDEAHEVFGFFRRSGVDVTQESIQREGICTDQIRRIMDGLRRHTVQKYSLTELFICVYSVYTDGRLCNFTIRQAAHVFPDHGPNQAAHCCR
jgi:hypothetical protein